MSSKSEIKTENKYTDILEHEFEMPECKFCATCGSCRYYEMYGFGKARCTLHGGDTSSTSSACGSYE